MSNTFFYTPSEIISYGNRIILAHVHTKKTLHSHNYKYTHEGTSGQQQVTTWGGRDENDWWDVYPPKDSKIPSGTNVKYGDVVRLRHVGTGQFLHSHGNHKSPVTKQQEVTAYDAQDLNDDWRLEEISGANAGSPWNKNAVVRLLHVHTNHSLHSHDIQFDVGGGDKQNEVTGWPIASKDLNDEWKVDSLK